MGTGDFWELKPWPGFILLQTLGGGPLENDSTIKVFVMMRTKDINNVFDSIIIFELTLVWNNVFSNIWLKMVSIM